MAIGDFFLHLFDTDGFPARWYCGHWSEAHGWLHIISDAAIFGAYAAIPITIVIFSLRQKELHFPKLYWLFAAFIFFCGFGHLIEATIFWHPWYRFSGLIKLLTAIVSWATVMAIVKILPSALKLPSLGRLNSELQQQNQLLKSAQLEVEQAMNALRASEALNRSTIESSPDCIKILSLEGRLIHMTPRACRLMEVDNFCDVEGKDWLSFWNGVGKEKGREALEVARSGGKGQFQSPCPTLKGQLKWWDVIVTPINGADGKPEKLLAVSRDISEQRRSEAQIRLLDACMARMDDITIITEAVSSDGSWPRIAYVNDAFEQRTAYTPAEVLGKTQQILQGAETLPEELNHILAAFNAGTPARAEIIYYTKKGEAFWVELNMTPIADQQGAIKNWVLIGRDVSARKQQEAADIILNQRLKRFHATLSELRNLQEQDFSLFLKTALEQVAKLLDVERVSFWSFNKEIQTLSCHDLYRKGTQLHESGMVLDKKDYPAYFEAILTQKPICADNAYEHPATSEFGKNYLAPLGIASMLDIPIHHAGWLEGVLCVEHVGKPRIWTRDEVEFTDALAGIILLVREIEKLTKAEAELSKVNNNLEQVVIERTGALSRSERAHRSTFEQAAIGIAHLNLEGRYLRVNPRLCSILGYTESELASRDFKKITHLADLAKVTDGIHQLAERKLDGFTTEKRLLTKEGNYKWVQVTASPVWESPQTLAYIICFIEDISARKRTETALIESEERFRLMVSCVKDYAIFMLDTEGRVVSWNSGAERLSGYAAEDIIGKDITIFFLPEDIEKHKSSRELAVAITEGRMEDTGWRLRKDGTRFWANVIVTAIYDGLGNLRGFAKVIRDITLQRENELKTQRVQKQFHDLFEFAPDAIIMTNSDGFITLLNQQAETLFGYPRAELLGQPIEILMPGSARRAHVQLREKFLQTAMPRAMGAGRPNLRGRKKNGHEFPVDISLSPLESDEGVLVAAAIRDVTEREQTQMRELRTQRLESIGTLAGGIAHDLNNALAPILIATEMLRMEHPSAQEMIDTIESSAKHGADMVRQLVTFAKGVDGERLIVQPTYLIKDMQKLIKGSFPKNIELRVSCGKDLQAVLGDSTQLHQVLLNLCVNARDAMPKGGTLTLEAENVMVDAATLSAEPKAKPGKHVVLRVKDTGEGIPVDVQDRMFEPFFTTKGPNRGTGLGLSTVMGIVRSHGGFIHFASTVRQGTTFEVFLPAQDASETDTTLLTKAITMFKGNGEKILVVDDEMNVRQIIRRVLTNLNFNVIMASDGAEALRKVAEHHHDLKLVITDLHMPNMDGLTLVRSLKRMAPEISIIVTSGRMEEKDASEFKKLNVQTTLDKPFTAEKLIEAVKKLL